MTKDLEWLIFTQGLINGGLDTERICHTDVFQILTLYDSINVIDVDKVVAYVQSLQKEDGSFAGDIWGKPGFIYSVLRTSLSW